MLLVAYAGQVMEVCHHHFVHQLDMSSSSTSDKGTDLYSNSAR
uniref:Uncharacterized protein n=1 Tax=Setaria italica TaxID=4555 RepID=K3ZPR1_SETIT